MTPIRDSTVSPVHPPLTPGALNARNQLLAELSKAKYASARPNWLEQQVQNIEDWFRSLFDQVSAPTAGVGDAILTIVIIVLAVAAITVAFLVFGLPRINRRGKGANALFGEEDERDARALRKAAEAAASSGDYSTAILERFRAIARDLTERVVVTTFPGTTAHAFAEEAARAFPDSRTELAHTANTFDRVRYLGATGTRDQWLAVSELDTKLLATRPLLDGVPA